MAQNFEKKINFMDIIKNPNSTANRQIREERSRSNNSLAQGPEEQAGHTRTSARTFEIAPSMDYDNEYNSQRNKSPSFGSTAQNLLFAAPSRNTTSPAFFNTVDNSNKNTGFQRVLKSNTEQEFLSKQSNRHEIPSQQAVLNARHLQAKRNTEPQNFYDDNNYSQARRNRNLDVSETYDQQANEAEQWLRQRDENKQRMNTIISKSRDTANRSNYTAQNSSNFSTLFKQSLESSNKEFEKLFSEHKKMVQKVNIFWLGFLLVILLVIKYVLREPIIDHRPYCINDVVTDNCRKCPQGAICDSYDVVGCKFGYNHSKSWSIIGQSKLLCEPDEELDAAVKNTAQEVYSIMQANTLEKHCQTYDLEYIEVWTIGKLESEAKKLSSRYNTDSTFIYNFSKKLKNGQFESMGLYSDKSNVNDVYIDQVSYPISCRLKIFSHKHRFLLIIISITVITLFLIGLRLKFAVMCFKEGYKGFDHLRNAYLVKGKEMLLKQAIRQLYDERVISMYNVHIKNVIFNLCQDSSNPKISWRTREKHGGQVEFLVFIDKN